MCTSRSGVSYRVLDPDPIRSRIVSSNQGPAPTILRKLFILCYTKLQVRTVVITFIMP
jgi:hypothetical protein